MLASSEKKTPRSGPQSVGRIFAILDVLAEKSAMSLGDLAFASEAPKSSLMTLLAGLVEEQVLIRDEKGLYSLGPRVVGLAMRLAGTRDLAKLVRPVMERLEKETGETVVFGAMAPDAEMAHYLDRVESRNAIRYAVAIGERRELYCSSMGKVLLAFLPEERLQRYLQTSERTQYTEKTLIRVSELKREITEIRQTGIARSCDERLIGASGLGAPIFGNDGKLSAGLVIAGPSERFTPQMEKHIPFLRKAAADCTHLAGGIVPDHLK
ncbi:MAG: IclR family transcriptional regulator [Sneathiellales bacterium]|nr:IclR family transcriptional regulator [Sneathiellales bacterium]